MLALASGLSALGTGPTRDPGGFVLASVLLLGVTRITPRRGLQGLLGLAFLVAILLAAHVAAQATFAALIGDLAGRSPAPSVGLVALAVAVVAMMTALVCLQLRAPATSRSAAWARAYLLAANGLYLNTMANRWVLWLWPAPPSRSSSLGAKA